MASEKGATYLDKLCHKFYDEPKGRGEKTDYVCRLCGGPLETYYCEERLYLVRCVDCGTLALVKTTSPQAAAGVTLARPTLTPPNEPLTLDELREMDGEPVWDEKGKCYLVDTTYQFCSDSDIEIAIVDKRSIKRYPYRRTLYRRPPEGEEENACRM